MKIDIEFRDLLPALTTEELAGLEQSLINEGCQDSLKVWAEEDILIDGHNRYAICQKHDIDFVEEQVSLPGRMAAMEWIEKRQVSQRNLSWDQKHLIMGRAYERTKKAQGGQIPGTRIGKSCLSLTEDILAKQYDVSPRTIKNAAADYRLIADKPELQREILSKEKKFKDVKKDIKKVEREDKRAEIAVKGSSVPETERWCIYHDNMETWTAPRQYDFIITDPPYPKEYLHLYETLAIRSNEWLKDGGLLVAMCGQSYLNQIYDMLNKHLTYYWTACYLTPGQPTPLRQINVNTTWKPLIIMRKGTYTGKIFGDVFKSDLNEKDFHKWGQSISGMTDIVSKLCLPGQYILDPFCGAGTTGIAAIKHKCLFDGVELDIENVNISKGRINDTTKE